MVWLRTCYGIEEQVVANAGSKDITYKIKEKGKQTKRYTVDFEDDIPFIKRYGKKLTLEGFTSTEKKGATLGSFIQGKRVSRKVNLYSYMDYKQFIYITTSLSEAMVKEYVLVAKNISFRNTDSVDSKISITDTLKKHLVPLDSSISIINGFDAKRIRV